MTTKTMETDLTRKPYTLELTEAEYTMLTEFEPCKCGHLEALHNTFDWVFCMVDPTIGHCP
jgi:hypothetical protein